MIADGTRAAQAARAVGRSSAWITNLAARYNDGGFDAVPDKDKLVKAERASTVNKELALELDAALHEQAPDGGLWTANKVADLIAAKTGRRLHETSAWRIMRSLGFTLQTPRPQHSKAASADEQDQWKKNSSKRSKS